MKVRTKHNRIFTLSDRAVENLKKESKVWGVSMSSYVERMLLDLDTGMAEGVRRDAINLPIPAWNRLAQIAQDNNIGITGAIQLLLANYGG